jgi:hypothetical protein
MILNMISIPFTVPKIAKKSKYLERNDQNATQLTDREIPSRDHQCNPKWLWMHYGSAWNGGYRN